MESSKQDFVDNNKNISVSELSAVQIKSIFADVQEQTFFGGCPVDHGQYFHPEQGVLTSEGYEYDGELYAESFHR